jgi:hypothetical protein
MAKLFFMPAAAAARNDYRTSDADLSEAVETALDSLRDGTAKSSAWRSESMSAFLTTIRLRGRGESEWVIVWRRQADDSILIVYIGIL